MSGAELNKTRKSLNIVEFLLSYFVKVVYALKLLIFIFGDGDTSRGIPKIYNTKIKMQRGNLVTFITLHDQINVLVYSDLFTNYEENFLHEKHRY